MRENTLDRTLMIGVVVVCMEEAGIVVWRMVVAVVGERQTRAWSTGREAR